MATIRDLPCEVILMVLKYLHLFDVEAVARTLNAKLFQAATPLLQPHKSWMRNALQMNDFFPPEDDDERATYDRSLFPGYLWPYCRCWGNNVDQLSNKECEDFGLTPTQGPYIPSSPPDLRSWMKLDGTFEWLPPHSTVMANEMMPHTGREGDRAVGSRGEIDRLVRQAKRAGLTLPDGFEAFLRSDRLHHRIPSMSAWYFKLSELVKCPPEFGGDGRGYLCRFHCDQQYCAFAYLYLHPSGNHCVVVSEIDVYESSKYREAEDDPETEAEDTATSKTPGHGKDGEIDGDEDKTENREDDKEDGDEEEDEEDDEDREGDDWRVPHKLDFHLHSSTFEEYLVTYYYEHLLLFGHSNKTHQGLRDYVRHAYLPQKVLASMRS